MELTNKTDKRRKKTVEISSMLYGKIPPQAKNIECAVLGTILTFPDTFDVCIETLIPESFYVESNQRVYRTMISMRRRHVPIDVVTLVEELRQREELDICGGPFYITTLQNGVEARSIASIQTYCRIVAQKFIQRELIRVAAEIIQDAYEDSADAFELLSEAENKVLKISETGVSGGTLTMEQVLDQAVIKIDGYMKNESGITGVPTGFHELDKYTRGWQNGDLIILAARPSVGKTAFALNLIRNAASNPINPVPVFVNSLEMKAVFLALRMLATESKVVMHRIQTGRFDDGQFEEVMVKARASLAKLNIHFDENTNINLRVLSAKARRLKKKENIGLLVIDYLQLMGGEDEKNGSREQEVSKISRGLKNLATELDIPVIALSQLSREHIKSVNWHSGPPLSALRESGAIEQDADVVGMLWGANDDEIQKDGSLDGKRKFRIVKQRNGVLATVELEFKHEIQLFKAIENIAGNLKPVAQADLEFKTGMKMSDNGDGDDLPF